MPLAMKNKIKIGYPAMIFSALILLLCLNIVVVYGENLLLLNASKILFVPFILMLFFIKHKTLSFLFIAFLLFSFLGDSASWFSSEASVASSSNIMYLLSYMALIAIAIPYFKPGKIDKIVGTYLLFILIIKVYFLYAICSLLGNFIIDGTEMLLFGAKSLALILLVFIAFAVYLCTPTKSSILFLVMAICFAFSDVLDYVVNYYIYDWSILMIERILYMAGLLYAFKYVIETNKASKTDYIENEVKESVFSSKDKILA